MNQISYDELLKINKQPSNTCPVINCLLYSGHQKTRNVRFKIDSFDDTAIISSYELKDLYMIVSKLDNWAYDILNIYDDLPENIKDNMKESNIENVIIEINRNLNLDYMPEIDNGVDIVNGIAEEIEKIIINYTDNIKEIDDLENEIGILSNKIGESEDNDINYEIEETENNIKKIYSEQDNLDSYFKSSENKFEHETDLFSELLEKLRERNDLLRQNTKELKSAIIEYASEYIDIYQPIDYLNKKNKKDDKIINIGLLNCQRSPNYLNIFKKLKDQKYITSEQNEEYINYYKDYTNKNLDFKAKYNIERNRFINDDFALKNILKFIKDNGYEGVRYYKNETEFMSDRENFIEHKIIKLKNKISI